MLQKLSFPIRSVFVLMATLLLVTGCSTPKPWYNDRVADWESLEKPAGSPEYSLFLIGDAGKPEKERQEPTFKLMGQHLDQLERKNTAVVWLGDNLYPVGLPDEADETRKESERRLKEQVEASVGKSHTTIFVPGNHDWGQGAKFGYDNVLRAEQFVEGLAGRSDIWVPDEGCPGPEEILLREDLVLLAIDSQWWLHKHEKPGEGSNCRARSKEQFIMQLEEAVSRNKGKRIVVVAHHPLYSYGAHGGYFPAATHLFPLLMVKKNLFVPLPVLGTVAVLYRKWFGNIQDIPHPRYKELKQELTGIFEQYPGLIYACGHDHGLQYLPMGEQHYIVSGAGCKTRWTGHGKKADFTYTHEGFSRLDLYANGELWMEFWVPEGDGGEGRMVFRRKLE